MENTEWRAIPSCPGYDASDAGEIRKHLDINILATSLNSVGYLRVHVRMPDHSQRHRLVHRLVCEAFNGPPPTQHHIVAHWDGDRGNNRQDNLRWATGAENEADKLRHGRSNIGSRSWRDAHSAEQYADLCQQYIELPTSSGKGCYVQKGASVALQQEYGITSHRMLRNIVMGRNLP